MSEQIISDEELDSLLSSNPYQDLEAKHNLPANILQNIAVHGERSLPNQSSVKGAKGSFQLMPSVAKAYGVTDPTDTQSSAEGAAKLLNDLQITYRKQYPNASDDQILKAVIGHYNGGWGAGRSIIEGREPPAQETRDYLKRVTGSTLFSRQEVPISDAELDSILSGSSPDMTNTISDSELDALLSSTQEQKYYQQVAQDSLSPKIKESTHFDSIETERPLAVAAQQAVKTATAGFVRPQLVSKQELADSPIASVAGDVVGTVPYFLLGPSGAIAKGATLAARAGVEGYNLDRPTEEIAIQSTLEGIAPGASKIVGKGLSLAGKGFGNTVRAVMERTSSATERAGIKSATNILTSIDGAIKAGESVAPKAFQDYLGKSLPSSFAKDIESGMLPVDLYKKYPQFSQIIDFTKKTPYSSLDNFMNSIKPEDSAKFMFKQMPTPSAMANTGGNTLSGEAKQAAKDFVSGIDPVEGIKAALGNPAALASLKVQAADSLLGRASKLLPSSTATVKSFLPGSSNALDYIKTNVQNDVTKLLSGDARAISSFTKEHPDVPVDWLIASAKTNPSLKGMLEGLVSLKYSERYADRQSLISQINKYLKYGIGGGEPLLYSKLQGHRTDTK